MKRIYLDNAATTPLHPLVVDSMLHTMQHTFGNPSSIHAEGRSARAAIEDARKTVARVIGASISEVFFTSGGTESNNMVLKNAVRDLGVSRIISSPIEHHCVLHSFDRILADHPNVKLEMLDLDARGNISTEQLNSKLGASTEKTMVSLMHANNEIGTMIDLEAISAICAAHHAFFHSDTVQTIGKYPIDVSKTKIHFLSGSAHKIHGPKGSGFVYINHEAMLSPFVDGGSQERNMRGGTENVYGIVGLATALSLADAEMDLRKEHISNLKFVMMQELRKQIPGVQFNGCPEENGLYSVLSVSFPPSAKSELLLLNLDISGISASGGSACTSGVEGGSHVLNGIGGDRDRKTIRFSFSYQNTIEEIQTVASRLGSLM